MALSPETELFLARDVRLDRPIALKLLPPYRAAIPRVRERFLREARMAARLSHPNIVLPTKRRSGTCRKSCHDWSTKPHTHEVNWIVMGRETGPTGCTPPSARSRPCARGCCGRSEEHTSELQSRENLV